MIEVASQKEWDSVFRFLFFTNWPIYLYEKYREFQYELALAFYKEAAMGCKKKGKGKK